MGTQTEYRKLKAHKKHMCDWCWQCINFGDEYIRYRWFDGGDAGTCKMHPECYGAMQDAAHEEGGWFEWTPGQERPEREITNAALD